MERPVRLLEYCLLAGVLWLLGESACAPNADGGGETLARQHCGGCHQFPDPGLLDKRTWQSAVLPVMALRLGLKAGMDSSRTLQSAYFGLVQAGLSPAGPLVTEAEWKQIVAYYAATAPQELSQAKEKALPVTWRFAAKPVFPPAAAPPAVTCIAFDSAGRQFFVADNGLKKMLTVRAGGELGEAFPLPALVSDVTWLNQEPPSSARDLLITYLGPTPNPTQSRQGYAVRRGVDENGKTGSSKPVAGLHRPTQTLAFDLDRDGETELITCGFGYLTGKLSIWEPDRRGNYRERVLAASPGALRVAPADLNGDGRTDLVALFAQGDERIVLFENRGNGTFPGQVLLRFPPSFGSSSLAMEDFDGDGRLDILYTCGDNADYSKVLKPYHGVYMFRNEGGGRFRKAFFRPMHGAYRAVARDFDGDGDADVAAVSFFADYRQPPEGSFVYLENKNAFAFTASTLPIGHLGRWMTLAAGDVDSDGDCDLLLGNCSVADGFLHRYDEAWKQGPLAVLLENTTHPGSAAAVRQLPAKPVSLSKGTP